MNTQGGKERPVVKEVTSESIAQVSERMERNSPFGGFHYEVQEGEEVSQEEAFAFVRERYPKHLQKNPPEHSFARALRNKLVAALTERGDTDVENRLRYFDTGNTALSNKGIGGFFEYLVEGTWVTVPLREIPVGATNDKRDVWKHDAVVPGLSYVARAYMGTSREAVGGAVDELVNTIVEQFETNKAWNPYK